MWSGSIFNIVLVLFILFSNEYLYYINNWFCWMIVFLFVQLVCTRYSSWWPLWCFGKIAPKINWINTFNLRLPHWRYLLSIERQQVKCLFISQLSFPRYYNILDILSSNRRFLQHSKKTLHPNSSILNRYLHIFSPSFYSYY